MSVADTFFKKELSFPISFPHWAHLLQLLRVGGFGTVIVFYNFIDTTFSAN